MEKHIERMMPGVPAAIERGSRIFSITTHPLPVIGTCRLLTMTAGTIRLKDACPSAYLLKGIPTFYLRRLLLDG
jgi:hypothetical protein